MLAANRVKADVFAHVAILDELHAARLQLLDPLHDHRLFKLEARNAIGHQPARPVVAVIDRHLHAPAAQNVCR